MYVEESLPDTFLFRVHLNASYDGNATPDFELYPDDRSPTVELTESAVVELLWREGRVPQWIDILVEAETGTETVFNLLVCGRFTNDDTKLYYGTTEFAPFGIKSPALPVPHQEGQRFSLYHRSVCWTLPELARAQLNAAKVRFLELHGKVFDDRELAAIGAFPQLQVCDLRGVALEGEGLACLSGWPQLRHLRMKLTSSVLGFDRVPAGCSLESLSIDADLASLSGMKRLSTLTTNLQLESAVMPRVDGFLDGSRLRILRFTLPSIPDWLGDLPVLAELEVHAPSADDVEVARLLARCRTSELRSLSLRGTAVTSNVLASLERFAELVYLDVTDTRVDLAALDAFAAERPYLRRHPVRS